MISVFDLEINFNFYDRSEKHLNGNDKWTPIKKLEKVTQLYIIKKRNEKMFQENYVEYGY